MRRSSVKPLLKVKAGKIYVSISTRDIVALIILTIFLMEFALMSMGRMYEAEQMALFTSGYGLGYLLEKVLRNVGRSWSKSSKTSRRRRRRVR